jgi:hypothetical protein
MLTLTGTVRGAAVIGGGTNKKTGEVIPQRAVVQIEGLDNRGLVQLYTLTVPSVEPFAKLTGQKTTVPVRAWAIGATVNLSFEAPK